MRTLLAVLLAAFTLLCTAAAAAGVLELSPKVYENSDALWLNVRLEPDAEVLEALDAHIPLPFRLDRRCGGLHQFAELSLRLRPLRADYVLTLADASEQTWRLRAEALAAFRRLALPRPLPCGDAPAYLRVRLDPARLPAPLRLPALLAAAWHLDSGWVAAEVQVLGNPP